MEKIKMITDSAADVPIADQEALGIEVVPFTLVIDGKEYLDGKDLTPQEFYKRISEAKTPPTHSQVVAYQFLDAYKKAYEEGCTHLIYVAINSKGSGTYQSAHQAIELFHEERPEGKEMKITILDSKLYTMCYGYAVINGAKMIRDGATADEVIAYLQDWIDHVCVLFTPYDLKFARRSGRIGAASAILGDTLGIHPILSYPDGVSTTRAKVRGDKALVRSIAKIAKEERKPGTPYLQIMSGYEPWNEEMYKVAVETLGDEPAYRFYLGGIIVANAGPEVTGLVYYKK